MTAIEQFAKRALHRYPRVRDPLQSVRCFVHCYKRFASFQHEFQNALYGTAPIQVLCGPFAGMRYFNRTVWGPITPKWIGSYESELHSVYDRIASTPYDTIVDIGAAEGYYCVGLARARPESQVIAYDIDFIARRMQRCLAALNGVSDRVDVRSRCDHFALQSALGNGRSLVVSDIEGGEVELIDPVAVPNLRHADIIVECHPLQTCTVDDVVSLVSRRFEQSHHIEEIVRKDRCSDKWSARHPLLNRIGPEQLALAIDECRSLSQKWVWLKAK